jgi:hypothetical protein
LKARKLNSKKVFLIVLLPHKIQTNLISLIKSIFIIFIFAMTMVECHELNYGEKEKTFDKLMYESCCVCGRSESRGRGCAEEEETL